MHAGSCFAYNQRVAWDGSTSTRSGSKHLRRRTETGSWPLVRGQGDERTAHALIAQQRTGTEAGRPWWCTSERQQSLVVRLAAQFWNSSKVFSQ